MTKYMHVAAIALASTSVAAFSGCSGDDLPNPAPSAGASGVGGASAGAGGASAGSAPVGGSAPTAGSAPVAGAAGAGGPPGDPVAGKTDYAQICGVCHGATAGGGIGPNITGSVPAGIGSWDEALFNRAIREGLDKDGQKFCDLMLTYSATDLPDAQLRDIYAYLRSVINDTPNRGNGCP